MDNIFGVEYVRVCVKEMTNNKMEPQRTTNEQRKKELRTKDTAVSFVQREAKKQKVIGALHSLGQ